MGALVTGAFTVDVACLILLGFLLVIYTDKGFDVTVKIVAWILLAATRPAGLVSYLWLRLRGKTPRIRA